MSDERRPRLPFGRPPCDHLQADRSSPGWKCNRYGRLKAGFMTPLGRLQRAIIHCMLRLQGETDEHCQKKNN
ncbi:MAG: hypothetical protein PVJ09_01930 [Candidatus Woesebacteria bacterium]